MTLRAVPPLTPSLRTGAVGGHRARRSQGAAGHPGGEPTPAASASRAARLRRGTCWSGQPATARPKVSSA
jgi:hypothetical protein